MRHLTFEPTVPLALWVPLVLLAVGLLAWYAAASRSRLARRRWLGVIALMSVAVVVPLAILLNPVWQERIPPPAGKPLLTVLVDGSASMDTPDAPGGGSRLEAARAAARRVAEQLAERYEVRVRSFAAAPEPPGAGEAGGSGASRSATDLAAALEEVLEQDRPQGQAVLLLSDGIHNAPGGSERLRRSAAKAKALAAPVFAHTLGGQTGVRDLDVSLHSAQELAFIGQRLPVPVTIAQRGALAPSVQVSLARDGEVLQTRDAPLVADGESETVFHVSQPSSGLFRYEIRAAPAADEVTGLNNTATLVVRVVDRPVRVLLLEGKPYWDTKFLVRTLATDRSIELTSLVKLAEGRFLKRTIGRPEDGGDGAIREKPEPEGEQGTAPRIDRWEIVSDGASLLAEPAALDAYQIVILGRDAEVFLGDAALVQLKRWLTEGDGSLVCFRGPPASQINQRLGALMPVRWTPIRESRFRVRWTAPGRALRWLPGDDAKVPLESLPPLAAVTRPEKRSPLATVLATTVSAGEGAATPAIVYQPVGRGRVVVVEGSGMWRWAFLPPQYQDRDDLYGVLWRSLVRWLVSNVGLLPHEEAALRTDKVTFSASEAVAATLLVRRGRGEAEVPDVELTGEALDRARTIAPVPSGSDPGQFRLALGRLPPGRYRLRLKAAADGPPVTAAFDVRDPIEERLDVQARPAVMALLADRSGGAVLELPDPVELAEGFDRHLERSRPRRIARTSAWDRWWVLIGSFMLWAAAWGLRRGSGLV